MKFHYARSGSHRGGIGITSLLVDKSEKVPEVGAISGNESCVSSGIRSSASVVVPAGSIPIGHRRQHTRSDSLGFSFRSHSRQVIYSKV